MRKPKDILSSTPENVPLPNPNAVEFTTLFVDYCRKNKCKVFNVIAVPATVTFDENSGDKTTIQPGVIITEYMSGDIAKNHSLLIRVPSGLDFLIWSDDFYSKPNQDDVPGVKKIKVAQVHVYEKMNLPRILKARDLNTLRSAGTGTYLEYKNKVAVHNDGTEIEYLDDLGVDGRGKGQEFLIAFIKTVVNTD